MQWVVELVKNPYICIYMIYKFKQFILCYRATVTEEEIKEAFTQNGFTVKAFKFFPKDRKMALIQMPSMDDAVAALIVRISNNKN